MNIELDFDEDDLVAANSKSRRFSERLSTSLTVRVRCRESAQYEWSEMSHLVNMSPSGARLTIGHSIEAGQLLHLTMALPSSLRSYDKMERDYCIWALVRNVTSLPKISADKSQFEIGVAFIGKTPPASYRLDPQTRYELRPVPDKNGLWVVRERERVKKEDWETL